MFTTKNFVTYVDVLPAKPTYPTKLPTTTDLPGLYSRTVLQNRLYIVVLKYIKCHMSCKNTGV